MSAKKKRHPRRADAAPGSKLRPFTGDYDWTLLGLHLLILLPPFVFLRGIADSFRLPKLALSGTLALVAVALLCLRLASRRRRDPAVHPSNLLRSPLAAVLPAVLVAVAGLWTSPHPLLVARTLPWLLAGCLFLVAAVELLQPRERRRALLLMLWPAGVLAVIGLLQALDLWQPMDFQLRVGSRLSITSLAGGAFDLAAYLLLPLLLAQERLWRRRELPLRSPKRWSWGLLVALFAAAILATQTLGAIVAAMAGSLALWWHLSWYRSLPRRRLVWILGAGLAVVALAVLAVAPVRERVMTKVTQITDGQVNVVLTGRLDGWRAAVWMATEHPLAGVGTGAFRAEFGDARLALQERGVEFYRGHRQPYFVNAHNDLLEAVAEWGVPGALVLLWALWVIGRQGRRAVAGSAFLAAAVVAVVVVSVTNFPWRLGLIAFPWLLVLAELLDPESVSGGDDDAVPASERQRTTRTAGAVVGLLGVAVLAAALWLFKEGRDRMGAQRLVQAAESVALEGARRNSLPPKALDLGLDLLRRAESLDPAEVSIEITRGGLFMVGGRLQAAERSYLKALEQENRAEIWINLARMHLAAGDRSAAVEAARNAQRLDTRVARKLPEFPELEDGT